jgi:hypothetical protein
MTTVQKAEQNAHVIQAHGTIGMAKGAMSLGVGTVKGVDQLSRGAGLQGADEKSRFQMESVIIAEGIQQLSSDKNAQALAGSAAATAMANFKGSAPEKQAELIGMLIGRQGTGLAINFATKTTAGTGLAFLAGYGDARTMLSEVIEKYTADVLGKTLDKGVLTPEDIAGFLESDLGKGTMEKVLEILATGTESKESENQGQELD